MSLSALTAEEMTQTLIAKIQGAKLAFEVASEGEVVSVKDGVLTIYGLDDVQSNELIALGDDLYAIAMNLDAHSVGAVVLGDASRVRQGMRVKRTSTLLTVPVGPELLGRVVNALGAPLDGKGPVKATKHEVIEKIAPGVIHRESVSRPLETGIKAIDSMVPIGRGQRELIIGDRKTGKTTVAIDAILNQKSTGVRCFYVAIGCKSSTLASIVSGLEAQGAMEYTTVIAATASDFASLQYIAPYAGCTMAEYYRDMGQDALIVYDDLSKHAVAYRQLSLLLRRPPGREAFPGDIFYLHSRLLERAACVSKAYVRSITGDEKSASGSITALPIIETQAGDLSAFVPTNVISITDGQIFLESEMFNSGQRPAVNTGLSVSRVGGAAQTKLMKKLSGGIRIALAQYKEMEAFSQFSQDLDAQTRKQLHYGKMMLEVLKQPASQPLSCAEMASVLISSTLGLEVFAISDVGFVLEKLLLYLQTSHSDLMQRLNDHPVADEQGDFGALKKVIASFLDDHKPQSN